MEQKIKEPKTVEVNAKTYSVAIKRTKTGILVRKSQMIAGITVPLFETYVLTIDAAIWMQNYLIDELRGFSQN